MIVKINPSKASGVICAPPSKSVAHRALICAGLSEGTSILEGISDSQDMQATMDCLVSLGASFKREGEKLIVLGNSNLSSKINSTSLYCRESGSTLRFFIPLCLTQNIPFSLFGSQRLLERPNTIYSDLCQEKGLNYQKRENCIELCGPLTSGVFTLPGDISSQFISGLLFALPLLDGDSTIIISKTIESRPYIDITLDTLHAFHIQANWINESTLFVPGNQKYKATDFVVEGDYSNSAFLHALGDTVQVTGLRENTRQGDSKYLSYFEQMKCGFVELDMSNTPDLAPIVMAYAANHFGVKLIGTKRLKMKESDRGEAMKTELEKFGVSVTLEENSIVVGHGIKEPTTSLDSHNDHRIAMSCAYLMSFVGGTLIGAESVRKSYPNFFSDISKLGIEVIIT